MVARRRFDEQGLTLIELILSMAVLALLAAFIAGGLSLVRRSFAANALNAAASEAYGKSRTLAALIGSAVTVPAMDANEPDVAFDGGHDRLSFVGLSDGRGYQGGMHLITIHQVANELTARFSAWKVRDKEPSIPSDVMLLGGVKDVQLRYFGSLESNGSPQWRDEWTKAKRLPDLVALTVKFEDERLPPVTITQRLRQR